MKKENKKVIAYHEIGEVHFVRKQGGRNLKISIKPFKEVQVIFPFFVTFETARKFVEAKIDWIKKQQEKMRLHEKKITLFDEDTPFRTTDHVLSIGTHEKPTIRATIQNKIIRVNYPVYANVSDPRIQLVIRRAILAALKLEAHRYLPELIGILSTRFGFHYGQVSFRNNKTRWGSCSRDNRINLNIHLMRLPVQLREYIILHELCHTVHKHHQKSFWQLLDQVTGGKARILDKELNAFSPGMF